MHENYDSKQRFSSYWDQIETVRDLDFRKIVEVGIGSHFFTRYMRAYNFDVTTVDIDENLKPDTVASVDALPFKDDEFEVAVCCQVLEHLPFDKFGQCLKELGRVASQFVLISLPNISPSIGFNVRIARRKNWRLTIPIPLPAKEHKYDGQHYWEIGRRNYGSKTVESQIKDTGLQIERNWRVDEMPYHHFYLLKNT